LRSSGLVMPLTRRSSPLRALTETGTSCRLSSLFRAVTTISSRAVKPPADCAIRGVEMMDANAVMPKPATGYRVNLFFNDMCIPLSIFMDLVANMSDRLERSVRVAMQEYIYFNVNILSDKAGCLKY